MKRIVVSNVVRDFDEFKSWLMTILPGDKPEVKDEYYDGVAIYIEDQHLPKALQVLKQNNVSAYHDRSYDIKTLEDLAKFINDNENWEIEADLAIDRNDWKDQTGEEYGICSDGERRVVFNANMEAIIVDKEENK